MTLRARRRALIAEAVRRVAPSLKGTHERAQRQEFAESRKREGWSPAIVETATGSGPLARLRDFAQMHSHEILPDAPPSIRARVVKAVCALGILDAGRRVETVYPHCGPDALPLQRRTYAPARLRAV